MDGLATDKANGRFGSTMFGSIMADEQGYVYAANAEEAELARLEFLEAAADPITWRILDGIGVQPGWRCLEVAGGAGSVAHGLAERVGPTGHVLAIDLDPRFLFPSTGPNLEVRQADLMVDALDAGAFDLVHTRHLLAHIGARGRPEAVARLVAAVRPGGWLVVEDIDATTVLVSAPDPGVQHAADAVVAGMCRLIEARGGDPHIGRRLPVLLEAAGLVDIDVDAITPFVRAGDEHVPAMLATITALRQMLADIGVPADDLDAMADAAADPRFRGFNFALIGVWGRRPG